MGVSPLEKAVVRHGDLESERLHEVGGLVVGEEDDGTVEARGREERATGQKHAHHQHVAEVGAKEGGVVVGEEAVEQLLGELRVTHALLLNVTHVHNGQLLVAQRGVEATVTSKLLFDSLMPVLEVLEGEVAGYELGVVGAVLVLREEQIVVGVRRLLAHESVGREVVSDEKEERIG